MADRTSMTHEEMIARWKENPDFCNAVKELDDQYALLDAALAARKEQQLSQSDVAKRMQLPRSAVCRLEANLKEGKLLTFAVLQRYAHAIGKKIEIRLI